ncbi:MAG: DUF721 domain-containing protein [Nitrospiraceae bacterium]|nr:DUF721 domain-containing protein [Nitrospiraceae bacterium]
MEKTDSLLAPVLKRLGIEDGVRLARIKASWESLFDQPLSLHMSPSRFAEGELLINVDSPLWMQQLTFCSREILKKLALFGVREVRFRIGSVYRRKKPEQEAPARRLSHEDAAFVADLAAGIGDEEIRSAIKAAAERSLRQGRAMPIPPASRK